MTTSSASETSAPLAEIAHDSWLAMGIIALAQIMMGFNISSLTVSMGGIVETFKTSPTTIGTALVVYSLAVASFVMLGAKLGRRFGSRLMFQVGTVIFGIAMVMVVISSDTQTLIEAQGIAGIAAALIVPALVVLIASHYHGKQQSQALGLLGSAQAIAFVLAFLIAGILATLIGWRSSFVLVVIMAVAVFILSFRLKNVPRQNDIQIDVTGVVLAALGITCISFGFNNLNNWGVLVAKPGAPNIVGLSLAPVLIIGGIVLGQAFFTWSHYRQAQGKSPLLDLEVLDSKEERAAAICLLVIAALGPAVNFLIPLYIQIVQGGTSLQTAVAIIPYSLAIFASAALVVRLFDYLTPRNIGRIGFLVVGAGLAMLALVFSNSWGTLPVIIGLLIVGFGEGALLTLVFNVLVTASPKELAGDVGALRGTANNLATAVGTALAGVLSVSVLALIVASAITAAPELTAGLIQQVNIDQIDFVSNDRLNEILKQTTATPEQIRVATEINEDARLRALKISFMFLSALSLLVVIPAGGLPGYKPEEVPSGIPEEQSAGSKDAPLPAS